jgi:hypothetical protein
MTQVVALQAIILDDGRIFISAPPESSDIAGLRHLLHPTDPLLLVLRDCLAMNAKAYHTGPKPA